jgi:hypothetical protein
MAGGPSEHLKEVIDEPPPFLERWPRVYIFVICWLAVVITLFYVFSRAFLP